MRRRKQLDRKARGKEVRRLKRNKIEKKEKYEQRDGKIDEKRRRLTIRRKKKDEKETVNPPKGWEGN